ncbi:MAG: sensor histidine kinase [Sporichthyaceae bacterium]
MSGREPVAADGPLVRLYAEVLDLLVADAPRREVFEAIAFALEDLIPGARAAVLELDRSAGVLRLCAGPNLPQRWQEFIATWPVGAGVGSCGDAAYTVSRVVTADIVGDARWDGFRQVGLDAGIRACWSTPIVGGRGELLGTFALYHDQPHIPADGELSLVDRCTHLAAIAIEHARLLTESRRAAQAEVAQRTAEAANRATSEFLSAMSHELRTPLTALLGFASLLEDLEPERRGTAIGRIQEAAGHVVSILDDVLDIAAIEADALAFAAEPIALDLLVREVLELVGPLAAERDVTLSFTVTRGPVAVAADPRRARQVLLNLVSNAIKYNRVGGTVRVEVTRHQRYGSVEVIDTGAGIAPDLLTRVFVPFDRLGAERTAVPGSGLGLSLSRALALAMHGDLLVRSEVGEGTTAELRLPPARRDGPVSADPRHDRLRRGLEVRKDVRGIVLHVEDDPVCADLVVELFRRRPAVHLVTCANGADGLRAAARLRPDLILLDLDLPDMTGEEFLLRLAPAAPVAVVSGRGACPALDLPVFRKPIVLADLLAHVDGRLGATQHI